MPLLPLLQQYPIYEVTSRYETNKMPVVAEFVFETMFQSLFHVKRVGAVYEMNNVKFDWLFAAFLDRPAEQVDFQWQLCKDHKNTHWAQWLGWKFSWSGPCRSPGVLPCWSLQLVNLSLRAHFQHSRCWTAFRHAGEGSFVSMSVYAFGVSQYVS